MEETITDIAAIRPLGHDEAMDMAQVEFDRLLAVLHRLSDDEWAARTDCDAWDVRDMVAHLNGAAAYSASQREFVRQMWRSTPRLKAEGLPREAALSSLQVDERAGRTPAELVAELEALAPKAVRGRRRTPSLVRRIPAVNVDEPAPERWTLGYFVGPVLLRDQWMHRVDIARATGRELELTPEHDGRLVADVVGDWARRHGRPVTLQLGGPAGGTYVAGDGGPTIELDAVEFCRSLCGRRAAEGLLTTGVPF